MPLNSDDAKRPGSVGFTFAGPGMPQRFKCNRCHESKPTSGRKQIKRGSLMLGWLCKECA